jgi:hypothetical protein
MLPRRVTALWLILFWSVQQPDSQATLRSAEQAQAAFETFRRWHLPVGPGHSGGRCDVPIGRFCYWDDGDTAAVPEPVAVRVARARLLAALDTAGNLLPGDDWIAGQRVRYRLEDGRLQQARAAARDCRATAWWCAALTGLALHAGEDYAAADSAFAAALGAMPKPERCRWRDISLLLPGELRRRYGRLSCDERAAFEARWWWLAAPLLSRSGNDRRTEHFARVTLAQIERHGSTAYGLPWRDDLRELIVRLGPVAYWTQETGGSGTALEPVVVGHERTPGFQFGPSARAFADPTGARADDWTLDAAPVTERYAPPYAARFVPLDAQVAAFRRRDSCLVVAAYDDSRDAGLALRPPDAALVVAADEHAAVVARGSGAGASVLTATTTCRPLLVSVEVVAPQARRVARARFGFDPGAVSPGRVALSSLLLLDASDSLPADLAAALPRALGTSRVPRHRKLGLFWELYGLHPGGEPVTTSLAVTRSGAGWLRRAAESLGLAPRRAGVTVRWEDIVVPRDDGGGVGRALAVDLSTMSPGRYRIGVTVTVRGEDAVATSREIEIVRP